MPKLTASVIASRWVLFGMQLIAGCVAFYGALVGEKHQEILFSALAAGTCLSGAAYALIMPVLVSTWNEAEQALLKVRVRRAVEDAFKDFQREHPEVRAQSIIDPPTLQ